MTLARLFALLSFVMPVLAHAGDSAYLLADPRESISTRVSLISSAKQPLLSVFEMAEDEIGLAQLSALILSAKAGGKPRLLVDAVGNQISRDMLSYLMSQNVNVRVFHALRARAFFENGTREILQRMHDKLLTDGAGTLITGGRNSRNPYFGLDPQGRNFIDYDIVVSGTAADEARAYQEQLWQSPMAVDVSAHTLSAQRQNDLQAKLNQAVTALKANGWIKPFNFVPLMIPVSASFIHDGISGSGPTGGAEKALLSLLAGAQREVLIDSQFLLLTPDIYSALQKASARGVSITITTNGQNAYQVGADKLTQEAFELSKPTLCALGINVREYEGPGKIHSKEAVADGNNCLVWSFNLDPRSRFINYEAGVNIASTALCGELAADMKLHINISQLTIQGGHELLPARTIPRDNQALIKTLYKEL